LKHDLNVIQIYNWTGGLEIPLHIPLSIPPIVFKWCTYNEPSNPRFKDQHKYYVLYIQDNDIIEVSEKALSIIDSVNTTLN